MIKMIRIAIEDILEGISNLELQCGAEDIELLSEGLHFIDPVTVKLNLFKQNDKVYIKAESSVTVESECARCLNTVNLVLESSSENQYRPEPKTMRFPMDDIGIRYYSEEYIDLSEDIRESLMLEFPTRILCSDNCKGLCPHCGKNLNTEKCDCFLEPEEPQVSKFADLIKSLEANGKLEV